LPQLTAFYGIKPHDLDEMTTAEVVEYIRDLDRRIAEQNEGG